jgi:hypothetical protein
MIERYDALVVREKGDKSYWTKIGAAFPTRDGTGFSIILDALPLDGKILLKEPKPREDRRDGGPPPRQAPRRDAADSGDDIPF